MNGSASGTESVFLRSMRQGLIPTLLFTALILFSGPSNAQLRNPAGHDLARTLSIEKYLEKLG